MDIQTSIKIFSKDEAMDLAYKLGFEYERQVHYCPQASFAALQDVFHFKDDTLFKSLFGFHGGSGDSGIGNCGALVGGIAAISYFFGRTRAEFDIGIENCHATGLVKKLVDLFKKEFNGIRCRDCQKVMFGRELDFWKEEDQIFFEKMNGHEEKCPHVVGTGAKLAASVLWDELHNLERISKKYPINNKK